MVVPPAVAPDAGPGQVLALIEAPVFPEPTYAAPIALAAAAAAAGVQEGIEALAVPLGGLMWEIGPAITEVNTLEGEVVELGAGVSGVDLSDEQRTVGAAWSDSPGVNSDLSDALYEVRAELDVVGLDEVLYELELAELEGEAAGGHVERSVNPVEVPIEI